MMTHRRSSWPRSRTGSSATTTASSSRASAAGGASSTTSSARCAGARRSRVRRAHRSGRSLAARRSSTCLLDATDGSVAYSDARIVTGTGRWCPIPTGAGAATTAPTSLHSCWLTRSRAGRRSSGASCSTSRCRFPRASGASFTTTGWRWSRSRSGEIAYVDRPLYDYVQHESALLGHEARKRANERRGGCAKGCGFPRGSGLLLRALAHDLLPGVLPAAVMARLLLAAAGRS